MKTRKDASSQKNHKTKVAFILSQFPEQYETFLLREIVELKKTDVELNIFSLKKCKDEIIHPEARQFLRETNYSNFVLSADLLLGNLYFLLRNPLRLLRVLFYIVYHSRTSIDFLIKSLIIFPLSVYYAHVMLDKKIDIVHGYWATFPATSAVIISRLTDIPFSFTGHAHDIYVDTTMLNEKLHTARFIATCTAHNKIYLLNFAEKFMAPEQLSRLSAKIYPIYHGIDIERFKTSNIKFTSGIREIRIVSVGALLPCKGFDILIKACAKIKKDCSLPFKCTIVGGGPLFKELTNLIEENNLKEEVIITGNLPQQKVIPYYKNADIFALPIRLEIHWGIPNVVIEAAAAHTVVITGALPSIPELIVNDESGFIIPEEDPDTLADRIILLGENPELRKKLADSAYSIIEKKFNRAKNAKNLANLFSTSVDK